MPDQKLLTVREVARRCHRSEETIRRWIWSGKLPARKLGNQLFVEAADVARMRPERRVSEPKGAYRASTRERRRKQNQVLGFTPLAYDREQKLRELEEDIEFAEMIHRKYGPIDVTELFRQLREEDG
jgi:excisionase family DNA binding protein